jgi:DNA-binding MarR family transcriptional regulator
MTNTLNKLVWAGYVHIRPDWDDARRKMIAISPAGRQARDDAIRAITPLINNVADELGEEQVRATLETLRALRKYSED